MSHSVISNTGQWDGLVMRLHFSVHGQSLALFPGSPRAQAKNVLQVMESWAGPGNEASQSARLGKYQSQNGCRIHAGLVNQHS